jgi:uncharacterized membrane protein
MFSTDHLHPMLVHFPIALVAFGFLAEILSYLYKKEICLSKISFFLLIFGSLSALIALTTGALFTADMSGAAGEVQETHEMFAWITLGLLCVTSILRILLLKQKEENSKLKMFSFIFYTLSAISVSITGFYGGTLVYNYMMPL